MDRNADLKDLLADTFARKSAKTLNDRAGAVLMYSRWAASVNVSAFPLTEEKCYNYVRHCRIEQAPATRAAEARKGWRIATLLMELDNDMAIFNSLQIEGCIARSYRTKRMTHQSIPLSKLAFMALERATVHAPLAWERSLAGFLRFCVGSRSRAGDATRIAVEPELDHNFDTGIGYVDCKAHVTKRTNIRPETMRMEVKVIAQSWGLCEEHWAESWLAARKGCQQDAANDGFLSCAPWAQTTSV